MRTLTGTRQIICEDGRTATLLYYLLRDSDSYGAEIILLRGSERESAAVRNFTVSRSRAEALTALLQKNTVTPCTLHEVAADMRNNTGHLVVSLIK